MALLTIENLDISFTSRSDGVVANALRGVDLTLNIGEVHALVGESGSGKTVTSTCIMGLLPSPPARINAGRLLWKGSDLLELNEQGRRLLRGCRRGRPGRFGRGRSCGTLKRPQ